MKCQLGGPFNLRKSIYCLWIFAVLFCSCEKDKYGSGSAQSEREVKASLEEYVKVFNKKDSASLASLWDEEGTLHNPISGETVEGRNAIESYFKQKFEEHPDTKLTMTVENITFTKPDEATIKAHIQVADSGDVKIDGRMLIDAVKDDGKWLIVNSSEFEKHPGVSNYEKLEKLNWLVGNWIDESENIDINSEWKWDKHKNFLTERFTMKVLGDDDFEGFQMIGWDPANETLHSWVFDADGGFGEGSILEKDNSWYASMKFTLPSGKIGSATNIYTKVDENTYTFSSVGRDIDGTVLPNAGPFKIVRKR